MQRLVSRSTSALFGAETLSVIIPTLNAAGGLGATLDRVDEARGAEVIVVDGGSSDDTLSIATMHGAICLQADGPVHCGDRQRVIRGAAVDNYNFGAPGLVDPVQGRAKPPGGVQRRDDDRQGLRTEQGRS